MVALLTVVHVLVALILILAVLLQSARGTDLAGAFGGMGSQAAFGPRGTATFLSKATVVLAVVFMMTSISLAILANRSVGGGDSILSEEETTAPAETTPPGSTTPGSSPIQVQPGALPQPQVSVSRPDAPASPNAPAASAETAPSVPAQPAAQPPATPATNPPAAPAPNP
jgi:preprotein translocase subunit SecG